MPKDDGYHLIDLLSELGHQYRHFQQEHEREGSRSATRHVLVSKMQRLEERFRRLLSHWVQDEELRAAWTAYFYEGGSPPRGPKIATPPEFKGIAESGSHVEVQASHDGDYDLIVDGAIEIHGVPWNPVPYVTEPIRIGEHTCREISEAPPDAMQALADFFATPNIEPPWRWLRTLFEDGLIDGNFSLTPRGRRQLGKAA